MRIERAVHRAPSRPAVRLRHGALLAMALAAAGCAAEQPLQPVAYASTVPRTDALFTPEAARPGRLEYSPDRGTFAPVLTERAAFPTQRQANNAYARATANPGIYVIKASDRNEASQPEPPATLALFACKPGALDEQTGRVERYRGPVVHCATDFLSGAGRRLFRATVNFQYSHGAWHMQITHPPETSASWLDVEHSPTDAWWWVPLRNRYE